MKYRIEGIVDLTPVDEEPPIEYPPDPGPEPGPDPGPEPEPPIEYPPAIHPPGDDIREILEMQPPSSGQNKPVIVKEGEYTAGPGVFPHDRNLVVVAERPGGVLLNLEPADLDLQHGSSKIVLAGFLTRNGTVVSNCDDLVMWYNDMSFPIEVWYEMFRRAGGNENAIRTMKHPLPKAMWVGLQAQGQLVRNLLYGCDVHDSGDDGVFIDKCYDPVIEGCRIWNIDEKEFDPNINPWRPGSDLIHNDSVQIPGNVSTLTIGYTYTQTNLMVGAENGNSKVQLIDCWLAGNHGPGAVGFVEGGYKFELHLKKVKAFSNGYVFQHDSGWNVLLISFLGDQQKSWPNKFELPNSFLTVDEGENTDKTWIPPGLDMNGDYLVDKLSPKDHPLNPALLWRQRNPYENWRIFL